MDPAGTFFRLAVEFVYAKLFMKTLNKRNPDVLELDIQDPYQKPLINLDKINKEAYINIESTSTDF